MLVHTFGDTQPTPGQQTFGSLQMVIAPGWQVCVAGSHEEVEQLVPPPIVGVAPPVTILGTVVTSQSASVQQTPQVPLQQSGRSPPIVVWQSVLSQHSRHPMPGQHCVPLRQALEYSQRPLLQCTSSHGFVGGAQGIDALH